MTARASWRDDAGVSLFFDDLAADVERRAPVRLLYYLNFIFLAILIILSVTQMCENYC